MKRYEFELLADYFQFYLQDEEVEGDLSERWTEEATARMLAVTPGTVGVGTLRNVEVDVAVEVHEAEPQLHLAGWDHVVETGLAVTSGRIVVAGCTDYFPDAARIEVEPGHYRVRLCSSGLETVTAEWEDADDLYVVQLWPGDGDETRLLKQYVVKSSRGWASL